MAKTTFALNDPLSNKFWERLLGFDMVYRTDLAPLIGEDENSIIQLKTETSKDAGDKITFALMKELQGDGFTSGEIAEGNGESLSLFDDSIVVDELGHNVTVPNRKRSIDAQRVPYDLRAAAKRGLKIWKAKRMSQTFFNHVCGNTAETRAKWTGFNAVTAPTTQVWVDATGPTANNGDEDIADTDTMRLEYIDYAREMAETGDSPLTPINVQGVGENGRDIDDGGRYVMYLHPYQITDLQLQAEASGIDWNTIALAAMQGGQISNNPIYSGAVGEYRGVILRKANHVTTGVNSSTNAAISTVRRAVLLGAQSCALAYGQGSGGNSYNWNEELLDHKRVLEVSCFGIMGMSKTVYDNEDHGVVVVSSYAAAHTA